MKKSPKGILFASDRTEIASVGTEIQVQDQTSSPATHVKLAGKSQLSFLITAEKDAPDPESCKDVLQCTAENAMYDFALGSVFNWITQKCIIGGKSNY
jgi:hypothetical protein